MNVRFLGINGFEFKSQGQTLLIDPYVSRDPARLSVPAVVRTHLREADAIVLGHSHWDHAADVAELAATTGATIYGSETMLHICRYFGIAEARLRPLERHRPIALHAFSVLPLPSRHKEPVGYPGYYHRTPDKIDGVSDYVEGGTWAFLVNGGGRSFLNLGSANMIDEALRGIRCDYLLASISGRAPDYLPRLLACVRAQTLIPTHWDDFFGHPVEAPGQRVDLEAFCRELRALDARQAIRVLQVLETLELSAR